MCATGARRKEIHFQYVVPARLHITTPIRLTFPVPPSPTSTSLNVGTVASAIVVELFDW